MVRAARHQFGEKLHPLRRQLAHEQGHAGNIPARSPEIVDQAEFDRVVTDRDDDRDGRGR
jgi:hypothetical protein